MSEHVLRCPACKATNTYSHPDSPSLDKCLSCGVNFINCGPLPSPDWTIPAASALEPELKIYTPPPATADEVPKWVCPWCGLNVGATKQCKRCLCDLTQVASISLRDWVEGLNADLIGAYRSQAMSPMDCAVALIRLYRVSPDIARQRGAAESLVRKMRVLTPPPGVDLKMARTSAIGKELDNRSAAGKNLDKQPSLVDKVLSFFKFK